MEGLPAFYHGQEVAQSHYGAELAQMIADSSHDGSLAQQPHYLLRCGQLARELGRSFESQGYLDRAGEVFLAQQDLYGCVEVDIECAYLASLQGRYRQAIAYLRRGHARMRTLNNRASLEAKLALRLGCCMRELGYSSRANICFEYALRRIERLQDIDSYILAYTEHWDNRPNMQPEEHQARRNEVRLLAESHGELSPESFIRIYYRWGRSEPDCLDRRIDAYRIACNLGSIELIARTSNTLSNAYRYNARYDTGVDFGEQAIRLTQTQGYARLEAVFSSELSLVYRRLGKYQRAKELLRQAISLREHMIWRPCQQTVLAPAYGNLGSIHKQCDELDLALACFRNAYELHKQRGSLKGQRTQAGNIGTVYHKRGQIKLAQKFYEEARQIDSRLSSPTAQRRQAGNLASLHLQWANNSKGAQREAYLKLALDYVELALEDRSRSKEVRRGVFNLGRKGSILLAMGNPEAALPWLLRSYRMCRRHRRNNEATRRMTSISKAYLMLGRPALALKAAEIAVRYGEIASFEWNRFLEKAYTARARALIALDRHNEAAADYRLATSASSLSYDLVQGEETGIDLASRQGKLYEEVIRFCYLHHRAFDTFEFLEMARQPVFRQRLALTTLRGPEHLPASMLAEETTLLQHLQEVIFMIAEVSQEKDTATEATQKKNLILPQLHKDLDATKTRLDQIWQEFMTMPGGEEYVALRSGEPVSFDTVLNMLRSSPVTS
jgi:tetratricopeptide (TPR) repeat protein